MNKRNRQFTSELLWSAVGIGAEPGDVPPSSRLLVLLQATADWPDELNVTGGTLLTWGLLMGPHMDLVRLNSGSHNCKDFLSANRGWYRSMGREGSSSSLRPLRLSCSSLMSAETALTASLPWFSSRFSMLHLLHWATVWIAMKLAPYSQLGLVRTPFSFVSKVEGRPE